MNGAPYARGVSRNSQCSYAQVNDLHVFYPFDLIALIWGSFAEFCSQICSQLSAPFLRPNGGRT